MNFLWAHKEFYLWLIFASLFVSLSLGSLTNRRIFDHYCHIKKIVQIGSPVKIYISILENFSMVGWFRGWLLSLSLKLWRLNVQWMGVLFSRPMFLQTYSTKLEKFPIVNFTVDAFTTGCSLKSAVTFVVNSAVVEYEHRMC